MSIIYEALKKVEAQQKQGRRPLSERKMVSLIKRKPGPFVFRIKWVFLGLAILTLILALLKLSFINGKYRYSRAELPAESAPLEYSGKRQLSSGTRSFFLKGHRLEGVVYDSNNPFAVIDGVVVRKSDRVGDFVVDSIEQKKVILINTVDGSELMLSLPF